MHLDEVDALDNHATGLLEYADDLAFLSLVLAAHHPHGVALRHVQLEPLRVLGVARMKPRLRRLPVFQNSHFTVPLGPATRSSCTSSRGARAPRVRRYGSHAAHPVR